MKAGHKQAQGQSPRGLARHWKPLLALLCAGLVVAMYFAWRADNAAENPAQSATGSSSTAGEDWVKQAKHPSQAPLYAVPASAANDPAAQHAQKLLVARKQLELAEHTYNSYKAGTKYPQESRPISEHPDQVYPFRAVEDGHAMRKTNGQVDAAVQIKTTQSRIFVGAGDNVLFTVSAQDKNGVRLPLFVTRATARGIAAPGQKSPPVSALNFSDGGSQGDLKAGDNIYTANLAPANSPFAGFAGTVRVEVAYSVNDAPGFVNFDFIYTPEQAATWGEGVREAQENGALNFYLKLNVQQAGRYLVSGRVDDANGKPLALVSFNDLLSNGPREVRLQLFGKLLRDQNPQFPLVLRDVEAYLLKENTDPDRVLLPRLAGTVHTSKKYAAASFSDAEWESEQRSRYLNELGKDVEKSQAEVDALQKQGG